MHASTSRLTLSLSLVAVAALILIQACGGGYKTPTATPTPTPAALTGNVNVFFTDASTENWATIGVKVLNISLIPQGGGTAVSVYTAPTPAPTINLAELDQIAELLTNASAIPAGIYSTVSLTISGNPGDVILTAAADPETGFDSTQGATVPSDHILIQGTSGTVGALTVPIVVNLVSPVVVTANQTNAVDLEFDLAHPAFIVEHKAAGGAAFWAIDFSGPVRHHPIDDITNLILRHLYGTVATVATDATAITVSKVYPVRPFTPVETATTSTQSVQVLADVTNGTIYYDLDAKTTATIRNFSTVATSLPNKYVRVAARYQANGTLVAVRIWASTTFNRIWADPEGYVLHVNQTTKVITVAKEDGASVDLLVNGSTQFFFRTPASTSADAVPIATGTAFLTNNLVRGFKIHATVADVLATPLVAQTVDIEIAKFDGNISAAGLTGFTYTRKFNTPGDNYVVPLNYISSTTANGKDAAGNAITGYKWWNFTFPTIVTTGSTAIPTFIAAASGSASFGGTPKPVAVFGQSYAVWNDPANPNGWSARWTILSPSPLLLGTVSSSWLSATGGGSFMMSAPGGTQSILVNLSSIATSTTLVYQVDRASPTATVTVSPQDLTTTAGLNAVSTNLTVGAPVRVFGVPQPDGSIKAYVVFYYTGSKPTV